MYENTFNNIEKTLRAEEGVSNDKYTVNIE